MRNFHTSLRLWMACIMKKATHRAFAYVFSHVRHVARMIHLVDFAWLNAIVEI